MHVCQCQGERLKPSDHVSNNHHFYVLLAPQIKCRFIEISFKVFAAEAKLFNCAAPLTAHLNADRKLGQQQDRTFTLGSCGNKWEGSDHSA